MLGGYNAGFEPARTGYDWLSRDEAEVDAYIADPFCGDSNPLTYGFFSELLAVGVPSVEPDALASIPSSVPVLLVAGSEDPVGGPGGAGVAELERRLRAAGLDVDSRRYEGARHEILNETNRDEVTADIIGWLDSHI
jgi:alpha-beta hydrolase superfamily lysophospholipase